MAKILIGIPTAREYQPFWESMEGFFKAVNEKHQIQVVEARNRKVADARNIIVNKFLETDCDYLLFLDDDHSGHTLEMLDRLLEIDSDIVSMKCFQRLFPHPTNLMDFKKMGDDGIGDYTPKDLKSGYENCDVVGFGMALIKRSVINHMGWPYFLSIDNIKEDLYFCNIAKTYGFNVVGCFDYTLTHDGVSEENVEILRRDGMESLLKQLKEQHPKFVPTEILMVG